MDKHTPKKARPTTAEQKPEELAALLATILPPPGTREKALSALGDQATPFGRMARDFNLRSTYSFIEPGPLDAGTSYFKVDSTTLKVPSVQEIAVSLSRIHSSGPAQVAVSLMCIFENDTQHGDVKRMEELLHGFDPETSSSSPPAVSISFQAPRVDVVPRLASALEALHKPCGLHPNMPFPTLMGEFLRLPEINRRATEIFIKKSLEIGDTYLNSGAPSDQRTVESLMRGSIQALGRIALFEAREQQVLESVADQFAAPVSCFLDSITGFGETAESIERLLREFEADHDLQGMCGLACLLTLRRHEAINEKEDLFPNVEELLPHLYDEKVYDSDAELPQPSDYDRLLDLALDALSQVTTTPDEQRLAGKILNALKAESDIFDRQSEQFKKGLEEIKQELEDTGGNLQIPIWARNNFLLERAVHDAAKPPSIQKVFTELLPDLHRLNESKGKKLISFGVMNPELTEHILKVIDTEEHVSSPALLIEKVYHRLKELLPSEKTSTITRTVNYLADELAVQLDVEGYQLGSGMYQEE